MVYAPLNKCVYECKMIHFSLVRITKVYNLGSVRIHRIILPEGEGKKHF